MVRLSANRRSTPEKRAIASVIAWIWDLRYSPIAVTTCRSRIHALQNKPKRNFADGQRELSRCSKASSPPQGACASGESAPYDHQYPQ